MEFPVIFLWKPEDTRFPAGKHAARIFTILDEISG